MSALTTSLRAAAALLIVAAAASCTHKPSAETGGAVRVSVMAVGDSTATRGHSYSGTVESAKSSTVSFNVPGTITGMYAEEGDHVTRGQTLARVRNGDYVNTQNIAQAELAQARDAYNRLKKLHDANALPDIKWVEVQNKLKQAENAAAISERATADATLHSPVDGVVSRKAANTGQTVIAAQPIYEIVAVNDIRIAITVPDDEIGGIAEGESATVSFASLGIGPLEGKVVSKSVVADPLTRAYTVKISIPNPDNRILPGMVGDVDINVSPDAAQAQAAAPAVTLPSQAVLLGSDNRTFVWVVENGRAARRFVTADEMAESGVAVRQGLQPGDSVIVAGMQKVGTGTAVTTVNADKSAGKSADKDTH